MRKPTLTYKMTFLFGGIAFAGVTYAIGTWLYELEGQFARGLPLTLGNLTSVERILVDHSITFLLWVITTTLMGIALGYLFDKQVEYRRVAQELQARAEMLAVVDALTQVYNHSYFLEQLGLEIKRTQRRVGCVTLLLLDIDNFKNYNDTHGHQQGDELLQRVARAIKGIVRETDLIARYGGDEFVVVAQAADADHGKAVAERIRRSIELTTPITISIGVASYPKDGESVEELVESADRMMYRAKNEGKNLVFAAGIE